VPTNLSIAPDYLCSVKCRGRLTTFHPPELRWRTIPGDLSIKVDLSGTLPRKVSGRCDFIWLGMEDGWFQVQAKMDNATMKSCRGNCKCYRVNSVCTTLCKTEYGLARVALYSKQCYVMWTLHYVRHLIIDVKTFWRPFLLFSRQKQEKLTQKLLVFQGNSYLYRTRIVVNVCYWNACQLVFLYTMALVPHGHPGSYSYHCERGLTPAAVTCHAASNK